MHFDCGLGPASATITGVNHDFRWNIWNAQHIARHGIDPADAEFVVRHARRPFPRFDDGKWRVWGQSSSGAYLQVVYVEDPDGTLYVIHARPLSEREKRLYRKQQR